VPTSEQSTAPVEFAHDTGARLLTLQIASMARSASSKTHVPVLDIVVLKQMSRIRGFLRVVKRKTSSGVGGASK
jgi:hypothetical protein